MRRTEHSILMKVVGFTMGFVLALTIICAWLAVIGAQEEDETR